jgi:hypothetical protein
LPLPGWRDLIFKKNSHKKSSPNEPGSFLNKRL